MPRAMATPTPRRPCRGCVTAKLAAIETFEDVRDVFHADAFAGVADGHFHALLVRRTHTLTRPSVVCRNALPIRLLNTRPMACVSIVDRVHIGFHIALRV